MPARCFILNCDSGSTLQIKKDGKRKTLFTARTEEMLVTWSKTMKDLGEQFTRGSFSKNKAICELHFTEENISRYFETTIVNGTAVSIEREVPRLKENAIPTIFTKKISEERIVIKKSGDEPLSWSNLRERCLNLKLFDAVNVNVEKMSLPDGWNCLKHSGHLVFIYITEDENFTSKKLIVDKEMNARVKLRDVELKNYPKTIEVEEIPIVLEFISKLLPCSGFDERPEECDGYVLPKLQTAPGRQSKYCITCKKQRIAACQKMQKRNKRKEISLLRKK